MQTRMKNAVTRLIFAALGIFLLSSAAVADASTVQYRYDELDRLYRAEYSDGTIIEYVYDNVGNRIVQRVVDTRTITASAGVGGSISPSGNTTVNYEASQTFTIVANAGYAISNVVVDGTSQGAVSTYTFNNVTTNHTISATFDLNMVKIRIARTPTIYYPSIQAAYNASLEGDVIQVISDNFIENININKNISLILEGGYNIDFSAIIGNTVMHGSMNINSGFVTVNNFVLEL